MEETSNLILSEEQSSADSSVFYRLEPVCDIVDDIVPCNKD